MKRKYNAAGSIRNNGHAFNSKMVLIAHNDINLSPKQIEEQMCGGWELTNGIHQTPVGNRLTHKTSPAGTSHIIRTSIKQKICTISRTGFIGLTGKTHDIIADTSVKVR